MSRSSAAMPGSSRAGSSSTGFHGPISCGEWICAEIFNCGARARPCASAASCNACCRPASVQGAALRTSARLCLYASTLRASISSTPDAHKANSSSGQAGASAAGTSAKLEGSAVSTAAGASADACCSIGCVTISAVSMFGAGNTASSSGLLHTNPSTACSATSHHRRQRVAAGRRGNHRHTAHTSATSTALCRLVQPSRTSSSVIIVSIAQPSRRRDCSWATRASSSASS